MMSKFYLFLWLRWSLRVTLCSVFLASILSFVITLFIYMSNSNITYDAKVFSALIEVFLFWLYISWSLTLLIALFRSIKYIFNTCIQGYELKLLTCKSNEVIDVIGYGDLVKVWRRWFMLLIWLVASMIIISLIFTYTFNIFWLYAFVILSGYISFILMIAKCKRVEIVKC